MEYNAETEMIARGVEIKAVFDWIYDNYVTMSVTPVGLLTFTCKETGQPAVLPPEIWKIVDGRESDFVETLRVLTPREQRAVNRHRAKNAAAGYTGALTGTAAQADEPVAVDAVPTPPKPKSFF